MAVMAEAFASLWKWMFMDSQTQARQTGRLADHRFVELLNEGRDGGETVALNSSYSLIVEERKREQEKKKKLKNKAVLFRL